MLDPIVNFFVRVFQSIGRGIGLAEAARDVLDKAKQATEEVLEKAKEAVQRGSEADQSTGSTPAPAPPASGSGN
jgi:hypothetical protein